MQLSQQPLCLNQNRDDILIIIFIRCDSIIDLVIIQLSGQKQETKGGGKKTSELGVKLREAKCCVLVFFAGRVFHS